MPVFEYRAKHSSGKKASGTVVAETPRQARNQLRNSGFIIEALRAISISDNTPTATPSSDRKNLRNPLQVISQWLAHQNGRRLSKKVSWFTREMATLLRVGTPMVDAIQLSIDQAKGSFRNYLLDIRGHIVSGNSLGFALRRHPNVFDSVLCEMITVGEQSGALQSVLLQAAEYREQKDKLKDRVLSALLYPALVFVLSVFVTVFLMTVVVPTLISSLVEMQRELPWPTRVLKFASDTLLQYGTILLAGGSIAIICFAVMARRELGRKAIDRMLLRMPLVGNLIVKQDSARLCMVTATLVKSGVELVRALEISQRAVRNSVIARVISDARDKVASGSELGTALSTGAVLPPALVQVFSLGQNTGQLEELLFQLANDYNHQVNTLADRLTTIMEPVLIVGLSIIVGFILMATLLPILETGNALTEI